MRIFATALLVLGCVCVAQAQEPAAPDANDKANMLPGLVASSTPKAYFVNSFAASGAPVFPVTKPMTTFDAPAVATSLALPFDAAHPGAPAPKPKFLYSRDDIVRWELGLGFNWIRFRSSIFNANAVGLKTSVTYYTNDWFGIEGNLSAAWGPDVFPRQRAKLLVYGGGPKITWRRYKRWDPWLHGIFGGAHEQPQTTGNSKSTYSIQLGGGADYNFNYRLSGRLEGNYVRTGFFGQSQNNFQLGAGVVLHF
jgi:opacity protein-like surface antigen